MSKMRKSNIELLRIISMLLIISFHFVYKSGYSFVELTFNNYIIKIIYFFGELGVNLFFLISGYFMIKGKFSLKKLICLIIEIEFYNLISVFLGYKLGVLTYTGIRSFVILLFPIIFNRYWFFTAYILTYIFSPYINKLIMNLSQKEYKKLICLLLIIFCVIPTVFGLLYGSTEYILYYSRFIWSIVMYFIGAYIRLYSIEKFNNFSKIIAYFISSFMLMVLSIFIIYKFSSFFTKLGTTELAYFWPPNTILMLILSISLFVLFLKLKLNTNIIINKLASTTLGIYAIHDGILQDFLWKVIFKSKLQLESNYPLLRIFFSTIIIFILGAVIDLIRQQLERYTVKKFLNAHLTR